jgi:hypothetical protein
MCSSPLTKIPSSLDCLENNYVSGSGNYNLLKTLINNQGTSKFCFWKIHFGKYT